MEKIDIKSLSRKELEAELKRLRHEPYRARQIFRWLYKTGVRHFDEMTDIPAKLREELKVRCHITHPAVSDSKSSRRDGTTKYLFRLEDGNTIETVFLPERARGTICLSSQVGCRYACSFCASAALGFVRNLTCGEMLDEVISVRARHRGDKITNLVFMGIGEPFDNYDNVMKATRIFNDKDAFNVGARKITVSTCGIIPAMEKFAGEGLQIELSISLHSADDQTRTRLVPANRKYPLKELVKFCKRYTSSTNRVVTFEYILIEGVNSSEGDARKLAGLLKGLKCKVNTISYNRITPSGFSKPAQNTVRGFMRVLKSNGIRATHRKSRGEDIDAGCGQLRISRL